MTEQEKEKIQLIISSLECLDEYLKEAGSHTRTTDERTRLGNLLVRASEGTERKVPYNDLQVTTKTTQHRETVCRLTREQVCTMLANELGCAIPAHAEVYVHVPGGGDWSNQILHIGTSTLLTVLWTTSVES